MQVAAAAKPVGRFGYRTATSLRFTCRVGTLRRHAFTTAKLKAIEPGWYINKSGTKVLTDYQL